MADIKPNVNITAEQLAQKILNQESAIKCYAYVPIYDEFKDVNKSEIIGWKLSPYIPQWLPNWFPPRVLDHYQLQYYSCTFTNTHMVIHWSKDSARKAAELMHRCQQFPS